MRELDELRAVAVRAAGEEAAEERERLLGQARDDAAAERARAQRTLDVEREAAIGWVRELAVSQSTMLAGKLLMLLAPEAVDRALVGLLVDELARRAASLQAEAMREGHAGEAIEVEVTWARLPMDGDMARVRGAISSALDGGGPDRDDRPAPRLVLREDPSLVSGAVVRVGYQVLDASMSGQLDVLRDRARELLEGDAGA